MIRLFVFIGSLLVLTLLAALVVPPFVDWNQFRDRFEQAASTALGQPVVVRGNTSLRLLPSPSVTFENIQVGRTSNDAGEDRPLMGARSFRANLELAPLLKGDVVIADMQVQSPRVNLRLKADGQLDWPLNEIGFVNGLQAQDISVDNISVIDGVVSLLDVRLDREFILRKISGSASARSIRGPWRAEGFVSQGDERHRFTLSTGVYQSEASKITLKLSVKPQSLPYDFRFEGPLAFKEGGPVVSGLLQMNRTAAQSAQEAAEFKRADGGSSLPLRLESDVEISTGGAVVPAFKLDIGGRDDPYTVTGSAQAVFGDPLSFRVRAEGQQIDVSRLDVAGSNTNAEAAADVKAGPQTVAQRLTAVKNMIERIPRFDADGEINLFLPAVLVGDTIIREVGMDIAPLSSKTSGDGQTGWRLRNVEAQLPGRTELRANGSLMTEGGLSYSGALTLASRQPSGLAIWLSGDASPTMRAMGSLGFSAQTQISSDRGVFDDLELVIDGRTLKGNVQRLPANVGAGERPSLSAELKGDGLDVDQLTALARLLAPQTSDSLVSSHDLLLDLNMNALSWTGITANTVDTKLSYQGDELIVERLSVGDIKGAALSATAALSSFPSSPIGSASLKVVAENGAAIANLLKQRITLPLPLQRLIATPGALRDSDVTVSFDSNNDDLTLEVSGTAGGSSIDSTVKAVRPAQGSDWQAENLDFRLVLDNDHASDLMAQLGLPVLPRSITDLMLGSALDGGRAAFRMLLKGKPQNGLDLEAALTTRDGFASAFGQVKLDNPVTPLGVSGSVAIKSEIQSLESVALLFALPLPPTEGNPLTKLSGQLDFANTQYSLKDATLLLDDHQTSGALTLDVGQKPRPTINGTLSTASLDLEKLAAAVHTAQIDGQSISPDDGPSPLFAGLDGTVAVTADSVQFPRATESPSNVTTQLLLRDGDIQLDSVKGDWLGGALEGSLSLAQNRTARLVSGDIAIANADGSKITDAFGLPELVEGKLNMQGRFQSSVGGATNAAGNLLSGLSGSGTIRTKNGVLKGLQGDVFGALLAAVDAIPDTELSDKIPNIITSQVVGRDGQLDFGEAEFSFNIIEGTVRSDAITMVSKQARLEASMRLDLQNGEIESSGQFSFDAGREAITGASPEVKLTVTGPVTSPDVTIDPSPFSNYLGLRASERRQRNFEAQRAAILERQRLALTTRAYQLQKDKQRREEAERLRQQRNQREQEDERRRQQEAREARNAEAQTLRDRAEKARKEAAQERQQIDNDRIRQQAEKARERLFDREFSVPTEPINPF